MINHNNENEMDPLVCPMCLTPKSTLSNPKETDRQVEDILGYFELPISEFRRILFCPDCLKLLALSHQVSVKIRKRKQAEEEQAKLLAAIPGRRPSCEVEQSRAKRIRGNRKDQSLNTANPSNDKRGESVLASAKDVTVRHSDDEECRSDGGECSISNRSRTRTL